MHACVNGDLLIFTTKFCIYYHRSLFCITHQGSPYWNFSSACCCSQNNKIGGKIPIGQRLALRGLSTQSAKKEALKLFSQTKKQTLYLIIHGKGLRSDAQQPKIKSMLQQLFYQHPQVLAYCPATAKDGGDGAMYALMRYSCGLRYQTLHHP